MKMKKQVLVTSLFVSAVFLQAVSVSAATYESNGVVTFKASEEPTSPVDPLDPIDPVVPIDPIDPTGPKPGTPGPLSIDFASSFQFGEQKIASTDQVYHGAAQQYHKEIDGETVKKTGPNYVQVTDNRGTEVGWTLKVKQNGQFQTATSKRVLDGAAITFENGHVVTASKSENPSGTQKFTLNPDATEQIVMDATNGQGSGTYLLDWGTDEENAKTSISLAVPGQTTKYAEKYGTSFTWLLTSAVENSGD